MKTPKKKCIKSLSLRVESVLGTPSIWNGQQLVASLNGNTVEMMKFARLFAESPDLRLQLEAVVPDVLCLIEPMREVPFPKCPCMHCWDVKRAQGALERSREGEVKRRTRSGTVPQNSLERKWAGEDDAIAAKERK